jgi:broad specificity phosphatase PhoE
MPTTFYLFRHGETFVTRGQNLWYYPKFLPTTAFSYGAQIYTASILDEGKPTLRKMGQYLKKIPTKFNASSQFRRCRQTVQIITQESGKEFSFDKRLNELVLETPWGFRRRVLNFLAEIESENYQSVAICTHAAVLALITSHLTGKFAPFPKPGVLIIIKDKKSFAIDFNTEQLIPTPF